MDKTQVPKLLVNKEDIFTTNKNECTTNIYSDNEYKKRYSVMYSFEELQKYLPSDDQILNDTGKYLMEYHKKGVYVSFKDGKLKHYLFLNNKNFTAPYQDKVKINPRLNINENTNKFRITQCLLKIINEKPDNNVIDYYIMELLYFFQKLEKNRVVPDCSFFINYKDQVLIHKIGNENYNPFPDAFSNVLIEEEWKKSKLGRLFSFCSVKNYQDMTFITPDDISRVFKIFTGDAHNKRCNNHYYHEPLNIKWEDKKEIAYFRGTSTGCGNDIYNNPRLKLAYLSNKWLNEIDDKNKQVLDAKIVRFAYRLKKTAREPFFNRLNTRKLNNMGIELGEKEPIEELYKYKYIINVDGNVAAYRLGFLLSLNSVLFIVEGKYKLWFQDQLVENKHYISIKSDLTNLKEKIYWCKNHDKECKEIAKNALELYNKLFTENNLFDYAVEMMEKMNKIY